MKLRETFSTNEISRVYDYGVSHARLSKNDFIIELLRNAKIIAPERAIEGREEISTKIFKILPLLAGLSTLSKDGVVYPCHAYSPKDVNTILSTIDE